MNYQYPLLNLVTRGHLNVKNPVAMQKFIESLDNNSCATILENLLFNVDSMDCAHKLDNLLESHQLQNNIRSRVSDSTINRCRDQILLREDNNDIPFTDMHDQKDSIKDLVKIVRNGFFVVAAAKLAGMDPNVKKQTLDAMKKYANDAYLKLISNPLIAPLLPKDAGAVPRMMDAAWTMSKKPLKPTDLQYLSKIGNFIKGTSLVALGVTSSIIAINLAYKRFFSSEARQCNKFSGKQRTICMCNAIITAAEAAKKKAEENLLHCDEAKDPQECRFKMKVEIRSWMKKAEEQKRKLMRLESINKNPYPNKRPDKQDLAPVDVGTASDPFGNDFGSVQTSEPYTPKTSNPFA